MKLRKLENKDAELMLEWMHDNDVVGELHTNFLQKEFSDCVDFINSANDMNNNLHLAIVSDEDEYQGTVSLKNISQGSAEFGITIRKGAMGKGYSKWAMETIIEIGKRKLNLDKIYWCVSPQNTRAIRFYEKNGYTPIDIHSRADIWSKVSMVYEQDKCSYYKWYLYLIE